MPQSREAPASTRAHGGHAARALLLVLECFDYADSIADCHRLRIANVTFTLRQR
jgi:hypothetical protein